MDTAFLIVVGAWIGAPLASSSLPCWRQAQTKERHVSADNLIRDILARFDEPAAENTWKVQGTTVIYHRAVERIAAKAGVIFDPPVILRAEREEAVILVSGRLGDRIDWTIGEALVNVNYRVSAKMPAYVYAIAEKRAKDRLVLKLIGLHGLLYSEDEADDFRRGSQASAEPEPETPIKITSGVARPSAHQARKNGQWTPLVESLRACKTEEALLKWHDDHEAEIEQLPEGWVTELREEYSARAYAIKKGR